jgi:hypothetical protein
MQIRDPESQLGISKGVCREINDKSIGRRFDLGQTSRLGQPIKFGAKAVLGLTRSVRARKERNSIQEKK